MKKIIVLIPCFFIFIFHVSATDADDARASSMNFIIGFKDMENEHWPPYGEQYELGLEFILRTDKYPFAILFEFSSAEAEFDYFGKEKSSSKEIALGLRNEFNIWAKSKSFLGAGVSYNKGKVDLEGKGIDPNNIFNESAFGAWVSAGNTWFRADNTELGFKYKISVAKADIPSGDSVNLGGVHYIFFSGIRF